MLRLRDQRRHEGAVKKYIAIFLIDVLKVEHGVIRERIRAIAKGAVPIAFMDGVRDGSVFAYLFTTDAPLQALDLKGALFNGDTYLIVELGDHFREDGMKIAASWLRDHSEKK
jgi:hypothetical protein